MSNLAVLQQEFNNAVDRLVSELYASRNRDPRASILVLMPLANYVKTLGRALNVGAASFPPAVLQFFGQIQLRHETYLASDLENRPDIVLDTAFLQTLTPPSIPAHTITLSTPNPPSGSSTIPVNPNGKPPTTTEGHTIARPPLTANYANLPSGSHQKPPTITPFAQPLLPALLPTDPIPPIGAIAFGEIEEEDVDASDEEDVGGREVEDGFDGEDTGVEFDGEDTGLDGMDDNDGNAGSGREGDEREGRPAAKRGNAHLTSPPGKQKKKTKLAFVEPDSGDSGPRGNRRVTRSRTSTSTGDRAKNKRGGSGGKGKGKADPLPDNGEGSSGPTKSSTVTDKAKTRGDGQGSKGKGKAKVEVQEELGQDEGGDDEVLISELVGYGSSTIPCLVCKKANKPVCWREREGACHLCRQRKVACRFPAGAEYVPPAVPKAPNPLEAVPKAPNPLEWAVFSLPDGGRSGTAIDLSNIADRASLNIVSGALQDLQKDVYGVIGRLHEKTTADLTMLTTLNTAFDELEPVLEETERRVTAIEKNVGGLEAGMKTVDKAVKRFPDLSKMKTAIEEIEKQLKRPPQQVNWDEGRMKEMVTKAVSVEVDSGVANAEDRIQEALAQQRALAASDLESRMASLEQKMWANISRKVGSVVDGALEKRLLQYNADHVALVDRLEKLERSLQGAPECADAIATRVVSALSNEWPRIISPIITDVFSTQIQERIGVINSTIAQLQSQLQQQLTDHIRHELNNNLKALVRDAVDVTMENLISMSRVSLLRPAPPPIPCLIDPQHISDAFSPSSSAQAEFEPPHNPAPGNSNSASAFRLDARLRDAIYDSALTALPENISSFRIGSNPDEEE